MSVEIKQRRRNVRFLSIIRNKLSGRYFRIQLIRNNYKEILELFRRIKLCLSDRFIRIILEVKTKLPVGYIKLMTLIWITSSGHQSV